MADSKISLKRIVILSCIFCVIISVCFFSTRLYITTPVRAYILPNSFPDNSTFKYLDAIISENGKTIWRNINEHFSKDSPKINKASIGNDQLKQNSESFAKGQGKLNIVISENDQKKQNSAIHFKLNESVVKVTRGDKDPTSRLKEAYLSKKAQAVKRQESRANLIVTGNDLKRNNAIKIGILIPSSTRKIKHPVLSKLSLTTVCLPSLYRTFDKDYLYQIYIGIDKGDYLESVQNELTKLFSNITVVTVVSPKKTFTRSVNAIARKAYENGMDYFVRINDDTSFETESWTASALDILNKYKPPNVGVVGPTCKEGNTRILTHDMVHRTHLDIFGFYYPVYFDNWWADDWITNVYQPDRSTKLTKWIVKHHVGAHGTRYEVDMKKIARLKEIVSYDRNRLAEYLNKTLKSDMVYGLNNELFKVSTNTTILLVDRLYAE